jgi:predicted ATPase
MAKIYPPYFRDEAPCKTAGQKAEIAVIEALSNLDNKWIVFRGLEWRDVDKVDGERVGETDAVVFHPDLGILFIEIKSEGIKCENGKWFHESTFDGSCKEMKKSPFSQARRSFFALKDKLSRTSLVNDILGDTAITYALWFPDITWNAPIPPDAPNSSFILDFRHLKNTVTSLRSILTQSNPHAKPWSKYQIEILLRTLCPDVNLVPPLGVKLGELHDKLFKLTKSQVSVLMSLRKQKQLLVEGCAGSGKTLLAAQLAREHALEGKKVLFTCYNKNLAEHIAQEFCGAPNIDVLNYHHLVEVLCLKQSIPFDVPADKESQKKFFLDTCPLLLEQAALSLAHKYDTIIVDEAYDFRPLWWISLELIGKKDKSYYVFYDKSQNIFMADESWNPPFKADPVILDTNVRNTKPVGDFALRLAKIIGSGKYGVEDGPAPVIRSYSKPEEIGPLLLKTVKELTKDGKVSPKEIVVLSPYRYTNDRLGIEDFVEKRGIFTTTMQISNDKKVRIGTIQAFKGLEADVIILCGLDGGLPACSPTNLYVGASRARSMLYVINQKSFNVN